MEDVSFSVGSGVFGLLGHNGAGKSTLMKALVTVEPPTSGSIEVCSFDTTRQGREVRQCLGYLPQELPMYPSLTIGDFLHYMGELKGVHDKAQVEKVLIQVEMQDFAKRKIGQLSGGMKRRVGIAQALLGEPPILVVDEPTAGLDPEERVRFRGVLSRYARQGRTVLLSTHIVEDVHQLCQHLAVLRKGRLFYAGPSGGAAPPGGGSGENPVPGGRARVGGLAAPGGGALHHIRAKCHFGSGGRRRRTLFSAPGSRHFRGRLRLLHGREKP